MIDETRGFRTQFRVRTGSHRSCDCAHAPTLQRGVGETIAGMTPKPIVMTKWGLTLQDGAMVHRTDRQTARSVEHRCVTIARISCKDSEPILDTLE